MRYTIWIKAVKDGVEHDPAPFHTGSRSGCVRILRKMITGKKLRGFPFAQDVEDLADCAKENGRVECWTEEEGDLVSTVILEATQ